ncbi:MAG: hypothetical protein ACI86H_000239 [bacterium]|jgi:hypothetical protein
MLNELRVASESYVTIAQKYDEVVEECASLEFIAINAGIASKQANSDSFMKLSNEIQTMSKEVTQSANFGRETAITSLDRATQGFAQYLKLTSQYRIFKQASKLNPKIQSYENTLKKSITRFELREIKKDADQITRALNSLTSLINIGKTMAVGGKIKAVYITGSEEKFRIITETMQDSINKLFSHVNIISQQVDLIKSELINTRAEIL